MIFVDETASANLIGSAKLVVDCIPVPNPLLRLRYKIIPLISASGVIMKESSVKYYHVSIAVAAGLHFDQWVLTKGNLTWGYL